MLRSFCVGALVGFLFGSSKKGHDVREGIDGFLTDLTSSDAMKRLDEKKGKLTKIASQSIAKISNKTNGDSHHSTNEEDGNRRSSTSGNSSPTGDSNKNLEKSGTDKEQTMPQEQNFEPQTHLNENQTEGASKGLDADKAQELADKLGAKPSAPEDENLTAFTHPDEDLKSA